MIEFIKHIFGICGDHWHPNIWTGLAGSPVIWISTMYYIKCKCGGWFRHKRNCENNLDNSK